LNSHHVDSLSPKHAILEILPQVDPKNMAKILRYTKDKTPQHNIKYRSFTFSRFTLDDSHYPRAKIISEIFKQLKALTSLNINLNWLSFSHRGIQRLTESLKHNKNISFLHLQISRAQFKMDPFSLCQALENSLSNLPKMRIKLSFSVRGYESEECLLSLLDNLREIRAFTSVDLTFTYFNDASKLQAFTTLLAKCKYLCDISLHFKDCTLQTRTGSQNLLGDFNFKGIRSLKNLKILFEGCNRIRYPGLCLLASAIKEITKRSRIEIIFKKCTNTISVIDWWLFRRSIKNIDNSNKRIEIKFSGPKNRCPLFVILIFVLFVITLFLLPFIPVIVFSTK